MSTFEQRESGISAYYWLYSMVFDNATNARQTDEDGVTCSLDMHSTVKSNFMDRFMENILETRTIFNKMQYMGITDTNTGEAVT